MNQDVHAGRLAHLFEVAVCVEGVEVIFEDGFAAKHVKHGSDYASRQTGAPV